MTLDSLEAARQSESEGNPEAFFRALSLEAVFGTKITTVTAHNLVLGRKAINMNV